MICLSFDTDHLDDARMVEFLAEVPIPGSGTFFCTEPYPSLESTGHETCPHPTLEVGGDWTEPLDRARAQFPEARGFRAHSCFWSHLLTEELKQRDFTYLSAHDRIGVPGDPFREAWGLWHLPIFYMDNLDLSFERFWPAGTHSAFSRELLETATAAGDGVFVFDFHPIHLLLNTTSVDDYMSRRDDFRAGAPLEDLRCTGYGARSYYEDLLELIEARGVASSAMSDAVPAA